MHSYWRWKVFKIRFKQCCMANTYFKFKQFTVHQNKAAMKVCTDACLFGAWTLRYALINQVQTVLDIGTGTGLLSLMLAQESNAIFDAIEIDADAADQAGINFNNSGWNKRLNLHHTAVEDFMAKHSQQYDLVICNPPFFNKQLNSQQTQRNLAMHDAGLSFSTLAACMQKALNPNGTGAVLLPWYRAEEWKAIAKKAGLSCIKETAVNQTDVHPHFRSMMLMSLNEGLYHFDQINIKENNVYGAAFIDLLKPYYLAF